MGGRTQQLSFSRKFSYTLVAVLLVVLVPLAVMEATVRIIGIPTSDDPFIHFGRVASFFERVEVDGVPHLKVAARDVYRARETLFPVHKGDNTFRVFSVGGSASAGWPHPKEEIYTAYLQQALQRAWPGRDFEIINVGAHAYAAYRVRLIFDEIIHYQPDLVVIYSGNNEFIEKRNYSAAGGAVQALAQLANRSVLYRLLRGSVLGKRLFPENTFADYSREHVAYEQWSKIEQLPLQLRSDPLQFEGVQRHYIASISDMTAAAAAADVPVLLMTVPVNLRGWIPNVSVNSVTGTDLEDFEQDYHAGRAALLANSNADAARLLRSAVDTDPGHAAAHFYLAQSLERLGEDKAALRHFRQASDQDANPFRALSVFNDSLRRIAAASDNVRLVDLDSAFIRSVANAAPGYDLFLDYVHPNIQGNLLIAEQVFGAVIDGGWLPGQPAVRTFEYQPHVDGEGNTYSEASDFSMRRTLLFLYAMMHQYERLAAEVTDLYNTPAALAAFDESRSEVIVNAYALFPEYVQAEARRLAGEPQDPGYLSSLATRLETFYHETFLNYEQFRRQVEAGG